MENQKDTIDAAAALIERAKEKVALCHLLEQMALSLNEENPADAITTLVTTAGGMAYDGDENLKRKFLSTVETCVRNLGKTLDELRAANQERLDKLRQN